MNDFTFEVWALVYDNMGNYVSDVYITEFSNPDDAKHYADGLMHTENLYEYLKIDKQYNFNIVVETVNEYGENVETIFEKEYENEN